HDRSETSTVIVRSSERPIAFDPVPHDPEVPGSGIRREFHVAVEESTSPHDMHRSFAPVRTGMDSPAVLRWLESTQVAVTIPGSDSESAGGGSSNTNTIPDSASVSTVSNQSSRTLHDHGPGVLSKTEDKMGNEKLQPGTVLVRLMNTNPGENLGIQIKPVFTDRAELIAQGFHVPDGARVVHITLSNGTNARLLLAEDMLMYT
ncbi:unnamed protein product, partial [Echinostoma caproni]|uniref:PDZ domain-containing protein n=1 Tax=Echinostoma caproni TaxID=27848 RepID=A0A183AZZ0_9TREM